MPKRPVVLRPQLLLDSSLALISKQPKRGHWGNPAALDRVFEYS